MKRTFILVIVCIFLLAIGLIMYFYMESRLRVSSTNIAPTANTGDELQGSVQTVPGSSSTTNISAATSSTSTNAGTETEKDALLLYKIDQLFIIGFRGTTYDTSPELKKALDRTNLGGVILFDYYSGSTNHSRNIETSEQLKQLNTDIKKNAKTPLFIAVDEEGGRVSRLKRLSDFKKTSSAAYLGTRSDTEVQATAFGLGESLKKYGITIDFAPVLDVNVNPTNPIIGGVDRSFSSDPQVVAQKGIAFMKGLQEAQILYSAKHFPGHGSSKGDSHLGFVDVTDTYKEYELEPFKEACSSPDISLPMIMVGHLFNKNIDSKYPASLSKKHISLLKNDLGCSAPLLISDDLDMGAIVKEYSRKEALTQAINAGIDVVILSNNLNTYNPNEFFEARQIVLDQVKAGAISRERIDEAYTKVMQLKTNMK